jgi:uncharacterized protein (TIGR03435 family)
MEMPVYALVAGKNGPKLSSEAICDKNGINENRQAIGMMFCKPVESMVQLAGDLTRQMDRPVLDMTGLAGSYAFKLTWVPEGNNSARCSPTLAGCFNEPVRDDPAVFSAIQDQLGLKLEPRKAQVDVWIVDRAERPTGN